MAEALHPKFNMPFAEIPEGDEVALGPGAGCELNRQIGKYRKYRLIRMVDIN